jgi:hypothetical protein
MSDSERQRKVEERLEQGFSQGEALGRVSAEEAGYEPLDAHGHDEPETNGFDRPGPERGD